MTEKEWFWERMMGYALGGVWCMFGLGGAVMVVGVIMSPEDPRIDLAQGISAVKSASPNLKREPNKNYCDLGKSGIFQMPDFKDESIHCDSKGLRGTFDFNGVRTYAVITKEQGTVVARFTEQKSLASR